MYDVVGSGAAGLQRFNPSMIAIYLTGGNGVAWTNANVALYPKVPTWVRIDQGGAGAPNYKANVMDVENGDYSPADIAKWTKLCQAPRPTVYCTRGALASVMKVWGGDIWLAAPDITDAQAEQIMATNKQVVAVQNVWAQGYDRSIVGDPYWPARRPSPVPVPPAPHLSVDGYSLPQSPRNGQVMAVVKWFGSDGLVVRQANIPQSLWNQIKWSEPKH
jgi:hypothetical protein